MSHDPSQHAAGRRSSQEAEFGTRHEWRAHRGVQLATESPHWMPESVLSHDDSSSRDSLQQDAGEHTVHEHIREAVMLKPGSGGGWYSVGADGVVGGSVAAQASGSQGKTAVKVSAFANRSIAGIDTPRGAAHGSTSARRRS